jgi:ribosomal protein S18 acetylase RimI-like enzyme
VTITIRPATDADVPALLDLYAELHPDDPPVPADVASEVWPRIAAQAGRTVLVAELDGVIAGTVDCTILPNLTRGARPFALVENMVVGTAHRRSGVGRLLVDAVLDLAGSTRCYKVQLLSRSSRVDAHAFYESCGFRATAQGYRRYLDR